MTTSCLLGRPWSYAKEQKFSLTIYTLHATPVEENAVIVYVA